MPFRAVFEGSFWEIYDLFFPKLPLKNNFPPDFFSLQTNVIFFSCNVFISLYQEKLTCKWIPLQSNLVSLLSPFPTFPKTSGQMFQGILLCPPFWYCQSVHNVFVSSLSLCRTSLPFLIFVICFMWFCPLSFFGGLWYIKYAAALCGL